MRGCKCFNWREILENAGDDSKIWFPENHNFLVKIVNAIAN